MVAKKRMKKQKLVKICWHDSKGVVSSWEYKDELSPLLPVEVFSVGYLIDDNKDYKTIAQSVSETQVLG
jgi:hypothetical protein